MRNNLIRESFLDEELRTAIWESMLQSDQERRYWHLKAREYVNWDLRSKVFLALVTSSSVAGWVFWSEFPGWWKFLTCVASAVSIALPFLALSDKSQAMTEVHAKWLQLMHEYEECWRDRAHIDATLVRTKLRECKRIEG